MLALADEALAERVHHYQERSRQRIEEDDAALLRAE
jgi:phosphoribosylcarboxyaminoimidazole (NCAIR) mutase